MKDPIKWFAEMQSKRIKGRLLYKMYWNAAKCYIECHMPGYNKIELESN